MTENKPESWSEKLNHKIDFNLKNIREKDIRFFRVEELKRNVARTEEFSQECNVCKNNMEQISSIAENLQEAIQVPGKQRRMLDKILSRLSVHMRKEHGFFPPYYFSYVFAFWGLVTGAAAGFFVSLIIPEQKEMVYLISFSVCIVLAYFAGSIKDRKIRIRKKLM